MGPFGTSGRQEVVRKGDRRMNCCKNYIHVYVNEKCYMLKLFQE
jgi:hypothetical protein